MLRSARRHQTTPEKPNHKAKVVQQMPLCSLAAQCCKDGAAFLRNYHNVDCVECGKKIWRVKKSSTRDLKNDGCPKRDVRYACSIACSDKFLLAPSNRDYCATSPSAGTGLFSSGKENETVRERLERERGGPSGQVAYRPPQPSASLLDDLGVSAETFRALQRLQQREISPEDYELLMNLHAKPNTKTLDEKTLEKVTAVSVAAKDFASEQCAVCLMQMAPGEEIARLKCEGKHTFHSHCIKEWLTTSSRCCPVDKQDLSLQARCLSA